MKRTWWICGLLALAGALVSAAVWSRVPDPMPTHWNYRGEPDGWSSRAFGLLLMPGLIFGYTALLPLILRLDPRREHVARSKPVLEMILTALAAFLLGIHLLMIRAVLTASMRLSGGGVLVLIGLFYLVIGNALPKTQSNWFLGIRTPWTLSSERVWHKTHRFGGWCFVAGGLLAIVSALLPPAAMFIVGLSGLLGAGLVPVVYSYLVWRQEPADG